MSPESRCRGDSTCSSTERIKALTGPVHESLTPWKHQSTSPPLEKMVKKSSMAATGKNQGPAPGTQASIATVSCCAKRQTRHTSGPGNRLSCTSARSRQVPYPTPSGGGAHKTDVRPSWPMVGGSGPGRGSLGSFGATVTNSARRRGPEGFLTNERLPLDCWRRGAVTAGWRWHGASVLFSQNPHLERSCFGGRCSWAWAGGSGAEG